MFLLDGPNYSAECINMQHKSAKQAMKKYTTICKKAVCPLSKTHSGSEHLCSSVFSCTILLCFCHYPWETRGRAEPFRETYTGGGIVEADISLFPRRKLFIQHICEYYIAAILSIPNYYATFPLYKRIVMQYNPLIKIKHIPVTEKRSSDRSKVLRFTAEAFAGARAMRSLCRKDGLGDHFRDPQKNKRTERK